MTLVQNQPLRLRRRRALAVLAVPLVAAALPSIGYAAPAAAGSDAGSSAGGAHRFLYTNLNSTVTNTVAGFTRNADGTLSPLAGSPFAVGGAGTGLSLGSQGAIQTAPNKPFLLVADAGSNQISVLRVRPDGSLSAVPGSPFASGGLNPTSIAVNKDLVYVANTGNGGANYAGFTIDATGYLTPIANSTWTVPDGSGVGDVLINRSGQFLAGMRVNTSLIDSFVIESNGTLTPAPSSPFAAQGLGPFGSAFRPTNRFQLFVSNAHNGTLLGTVSAFSVGPDGTLSSIGASPFPDQQTAPCWLTVSPNGQFLFTANAGSDSISSYSISPTGSLTLIGSTALKGGPGLGTFDLRVDPTGKYLYQLDHSLLKVSILSINGGMLAELASSPVPLPAGTSPFGIALT